MKHLGRDPFCYYILQVTMLASIYIGFYKNTQGTLTDDAVLR